MSSKLKRNFVRFTVETVLVYGSFILILTSTLENKVVGGSYTDMLRAELINSWIYHVKDGSILTVTDTICSIDEWRTSVKKCRARLTR